MFEKIIEISEKESDKLAAELDNAVGIDANIILEEINKEAVWRQFIRSLESYYDILRGHPDFRKIIKFLEYRGSGVDSCDNDLRIDISNFIIQLFAYDQLREVSNNNEKAQEDYIKLRDNLANVYHQLQEVDNPAYEPIEFYY